MRNTLRKLLIALPVALLFSVSCWAQTTALQGDVKGLDGKPLSGAQIILQRTDIKATYKVKTDKKGHYFYGGIPQGVYNVSVEVDGKTVDNVNGVKSRYGDPIDVGFDLKASKARADAAAGAAGAGAVTAEVERGMSAEQKAAYEKQKKESAEADRKSVV